MLALTLTLRQRRSFASMQGYKHAPSRDYFLSLHCHVNFILGFGSRIELERATLELEQVLPLAVLSFIAF